MYSWKPVGFIYVAVVIMILRINTCIHSVQSSFIEQNNYDRSSYICTYRVILNTS